MAGAQGIHQQTGNYIPRTPGQPTAAASQPNVYSPSGTVSSGPNPNPNLSPLYPYGYDPNNLPANASTPAAPPKNSYQSPTASNPNNYGYYTTPPNLMGNSNDQDYEATLDALRPEAPTIDPRYSNLQKQQAALSKQFHDNADSIAEGLFKPQAQAARKQGADNIKAVRAGANATGNLYSGYEQGAEGSANAAIPGNLANLRASINQQVQTADQGLLSGTIGSGLGMAGLNTGQASFNQAQAGQNQLAQMQQAALQQQAIGGLAAGVGGVAGAVIGGHPSSPTVNYYGNPYGAANATGYGNLAGNPYAAAGGGLIGYDQAAGE